MLGTTRGLAGAVYVIALANSAVAAVHDRFSAAAPLEQILRMLESLPLSRMLRVDRASARLYDLPVPSGAGNNMGLVRLAHMDSILIP
jgi:hypothetical protein